MSPRSTFQFLTDSHLTFYSSDDLVQLCVDYLKEYPLLVGSGLACPVIFTPHNSMWDLILIPAVFFQILLLLAFLWLMKGEEERPRRSKKDKKEKREAK